MKKTTKRFLISSFYVLLSYPNDSRASFTSLKDTDMCWGISPAGFVLVALHSNIDFDRSK